MTISRQEYNELREHLRDRPDIWTELPNGLWARSVDDVPQLALVLTPKNGTVDLRVVPSGWDDDECTKYIENLLAHWTSYGQRLRIQKFLEGIVEGTAADTAHQLIRILHSDSWDPENAPFQLSLPADVAGPDIKTEDLPKLLHFPLVGGGWLRLAPQTTAFHVTVSVPLHKDYGGGYASHLTGYVRPSDGRIRQAAAMLSGKEIAPEEESTQLPLPIE